MEDGRLDTALELLAEGEHHVPCGLTKSLFSFLHKDLRIRLRLGAAVVGFFLGLFDDAFRFGLGFRDDIGLGLLRLFQAFFIDFVQ